MLYDNFFVLLTYIIGTPLCCDNIRSGVVAEAEAVAVVLTTFMVYLTALPVFFPGHEPDSLVRLKPYSRMWLADRVSKRKKGLTDAFYFGRLILCAGEERQRVGSIIFWDRTQRIN